MGNNNKIKKQLVPVRDVHKEVALLLEDELSLISNAEQKKTYILSEEYPKTQKNNFSFYRICYYIFTNIGIIYNDVPRKINCLQQLIAS